MYELLSTREEGLPPIQFDKVSIKCRNQIISLFYEAFEDCNVKYPEGIYNEIRLTLGLNPKPPNVMYFEDEMEKITKGLDDKQFKDLINLICQIFKDVSQTDKKFDYQSFAEDISNILRINGLGYKVDVVTGKLIKFADDNELERIIEPCFQILSENSFDVSREYLLNAFEAYKNKNNSAALVEATKALEATIDKLIEIYNIDLKIVAPNKKENDIKLTVKLEALLKDGLCQKYNQSTINSLYSLLSDAKARNNEGAHAKKNTVDIEDHVVLYALDQTMSSILFLVRCHVSRTIS